MMCRRRCAYIWVGVTGIIIWATLIAITCLVPISNHVRLIICLLVTFTYLVPFILYRVQFRNRRDDRPPRQSSCKEFVDAVIGSHHAAHYHAIFPGLPSYLASGVPTTSSFLGGQYLLWTGTYAREIHRRGGICSSGHSHNLELLIQMSKGSITGYGSMSNFPCDVEGGYTDFTDNRVLVALSLRFKDYVCELRGLFDSDFSLGMRGIWSTAHHRRGWWRSWPSAIDPQKVTRLYTCYDMSNDCTVCFERKSTSACLPCGHVIACHKCLSMVMLCPACRRPISRVAALDGHGVDLHILNSTSSPSSAPISSSSESGDASV